MAGIFSGRKRTDQKSERGADPIPADRKYRGSFKDSAGTLQKGYQAGSGVLPLSGGKS